jgi:diaminohydroxyphosphoribosylaminopyrimidine deaminase/5-amino-6-(5-phosphoribosylamino)uracil reductase
MKFSPFDEVAMRRALEIAKRGLYSTQPNPRVGAVLARDEEIVGEGWHERAGEPHAEPIAIREAGERARGATAYVTLEPCNHHGRTPPCVEVLLAAGVRRVVYAIADPNPRVTGAGAKRLADSGLIVQSGLLAADAEALNAGFLMRMRQRRPFIRLKTAASLDGRTALANGKSQWITSEAARADVQHWRAQSGAVLTSAATVLADNPRLDVRIDTPRQPLRVVLDRRRALRKAARVLAPPGDALVFAASAGKSAPTDERLGGARIERVRTIRAHLDLKAVFARLAELEINDVLVEAGSRLSAALFAAGLVDEWLLYLAPKLLGRDARPLTALGRLTNLGAAPGFELLESTAVGPDLRLRLRPQAKSQPNSQRKKK